MTGAEVAEALEGGYLRGGDYSVRRGVDPAGCAWILVRVQRNGVATRLFGLRFVDFPKAPPTLRFWAPTRWDEKEFDFDFSKNGDSGSAPTASPSGVPTMCIPYHVDYYKGEWHKDRFWSEAEADDQIADLMTNILRRA